MKILFLTTANLSTNPRLYKELKLAEKLGYKVAFVAFHQGGWSDDKDKVLQKEISGSGYYLTALRRPFIPWLVATLIHRFCRLLGQWFPHNLRVAALAHNKRTWHLLKALPMLNNDYDLVVGHNLGALYPAWHFANKRGIPFAFDVEDYHPGEASAMGVKHEVKRRALLMTQLISEARYYTYASPKIGEYTGNLMSPSLLTPKLLINNSFPFIEFAKPGERSGKLKLVWFSQNINHGRGLEWILPVLDQFTGEVEVYLIGSLNDAFFDSYLSQRPYITVVAPLAQQALNKVLSQYDVGLALELNTADLNRQICLTNKIWAYLQSGLYILATDTPAQQLFMSEHPSHGSVVQQQADSFRKALGEIIKKKDQIREEAGYRYVRAQQFSWEREGKKLEKLWQEVL